MIHFIWALQVSKKINGLLKAGKSGVLPNQCSSYFEDSKFDPGRNSDLPMTSSIIKYGMKLSVKGFIRPS